MRAVEGAPGASVAAAHVAQEFGEIFFDVGAFRTVLEARFQQAFEREDGFRKRAVRARIDRFLQTMQCFHARGGDGGAVRRHLALQATEPRIVEHAIGEQTLALTHGAFVSSGGGAMLRSARQCEAIEEAAPIAGGAGP